MTHSLSPEQLFAVIETQNELAATALDLDAVMALVVRRARDLTGAAAAAIELVQGEEMIYHIGSGAAHAYVGMRVRIDSSMSGMCVRLGTVLHCVDAAHDDRVDYAACRKVGAASIVCVPRPHRTAQPSGIRRPAGRRAHPRLSPRRNPGALSARSRRLQSRQRLRGTRGR